MSVSNFNNEINLFQIIGNIYKSSKSYLKKHFLILLILILSGVGIGYFLTTAKTNYTSKAIIIPNFESVDYIYNDIELLNSKIRENDLDFLKKNKISTSIGAIEIEPIVSIYQFIEDGDNTFANSANKDKNSRFDLLRLFAEDGDINQVSIDRKTSKNYKTHQLIISSNNNIITNNDLNSILFFLNKNEFYKDVQSISIKNIKRNIEFNNETINQINLILSNYNDQKNDNSKLLYFNNNLQLNDLIVSKNQLIKENDKLSIKLIESNSVIKKISESLNIKNTYISYKYCFIFPLLFILMYNFYLFYRKRK